MEILKHLVPILIATISMSIPLIFAAVGGTYSVRSGIMALGLESMMMMGAFSAVVASYYTNSVLLGFLAGITGGVILGLLHGLLCVRYKVNQVISGIGLNLLVVAMTNLLMQVIWGNRGSSPQVAAIEHHVGGMIGRIPLIGPILGQQSLMAYVCFLVVIIAWIIMFKTRYGIRLRMVGENPVAASTMGLHVHAIKYSAVAICGALAGTAGAFLSIDHLNMFVREMTAGRGYIAVVIGILSRYNPARVVIFSCLFGFFEAIQIYLQGGVIPTQIIQMLPYIVTLLVLAIGVQRIKPPAGLGQHDR